MDEILYQSLSSYYHTLESLGYLSEDQTKKLLVLCFYRDFVYHDYRGLLSREDYQTIGQVLNCLFGSSCLIPYPDYLKMGQLHLGSITELSQRIKKVEDTEVLKPMDPSGESDSDIIIMVDSDDTQEE